MERVMLAVVLAAVAAGGWAHERVASTRIDRAIGVGKRRKPRVRVAPRSFVPLDHPNGSYGRLGVWELPAWCPEGAPAWAGPAAWRLDGMIQSLKDACRKGILAASYK